MNLTIWLIITGVLILVEIITLGLASIWFAGGALVAGIVAALGAHWLVQILVFAVVSLVLFIFTRPVATKHLMKDIEKTNADSLIGKEGIVKQAIDNLEETGVVKLQGMEWTARSADDSKIAEGEQVIVERISGVKLIVTKKG